MKSSGISSAKATPPSTAPRTRRAFTLAGPSIDLDPRTNAVRPDLADVRLADQVFAPHYALAVRYVLVADAPLLAERRAESAVVAQLSRGEPFDLLDLTGDLAWGIADARGLVGYVAAAAVAPSGEARAAA